MLQILLTLVAAVVAAYAALWAFQMRFIYFPRRYAFPLDRLPPPLQALRSTTAAGEQFSFYLPARAAVRTRLWLVFGGNAMAALDWRDWALTHPDDEAAFLLIEYPGYGYSRGLPSRAAIAAASDAAFAALAVHLRTTPEALTQQTYLLGHSLGAATALEFACRRSDQGGVQGIVLTAPFTPLRELAVKLFGPPVGPLVRERYDNVARLAELSTQGFPLVILHGTNDEVIPFRFGDALAMSAPWAKFKMLQGCGHNDLYQVAASEIRAAMSSVSGLSEPLP